MGALGGVLVVRRVHWVVFLARLCRVHSIEFGHHHGGVGVLVVASRARFDWANVFFLRPVSSHVAISAGQRCFDVGEFLLIFLFLALFIDLFD